MKRLNSLQISHDLALPLEVVTQTFAILAKRRVGKTYSASVLAEEMMKAGLPFCVLDPTGAWWGLRAKADGKTEGYPVVIIGGAHGDVPLEPTAGRVLADLVVDHPGWYVIDMSQTNSGAEQDRIAGDFAEQLYRRKANKPFPFHLFVDEADSFAPQQAFPNQKKMLGAFEALVRRGGIRGIGTTLITQRPAVLNKNVLTQADNLLVLQITSPQDRTAIEDWAKGYGTKEERAQMLGELASLGKGEAWFWSPGQLDIFRRVRIRERETFNSSATPKPGETVIAPQRLAAVDLDKLRDKIASTIEKAKADDPKILRARIADLELQRDGVADIKSPQQIKAAVAEARKELASLFAEKEAGYQARIKKLEKQLLAFRDLAMNLPIEPTCPYDQTLDHKIAEIFTGQTLTTHPKTQRDHQNRNLRHGQTLAVAAASAKKITTTVIVQGLPITRDQLSAGQLRLLDSLAWWESVGIASPNRAQVAFAAGYTVNGHFNNLAGSLRGQGLVDYPQGDCLCLTDTGENVAAYPSKPATRPELHDRIRQKLSEPQRRLFNVLLEAESVLSNEELAERAGYTVNGHFNNLRGSLRTLQLAIYVAGGTYPAEWLFSI